MQPRNIRFWILVLTGVMILSGGLPLSTRRGAAQPLPPDANQVQFPWFDFLTSQEKDIEQTLRQRNQQLEETARAEGRELTESERVKLVRRVLLHPSPDSPVKDVIVVAYEFSDGTVGRTLASPVLGPEVKGPFGYSLEDMNLDEGWYIVRYLTPEELQDEPKAPADPAPSPAVEDKPLSFLERVLGFFSPSAALACTGGCQPLSNTYTHSVYEQLFDDPTGTGGTLLARDGVKMQWLARDQSTCSPKILSTDKRCEPIFSGWTYFAPCDPVTTPTLYGAVQTDHSDLYQNPALQTNVPISSHVWGNDYGFWVGWGDCSPTGPSNFVKDLKCREKFDAF